MSAPRLRPGTPMERRSGPDGETWEKTPPSRWHRVRWWLRHHLDREPDGEWRDDSGWGSSRRTDVTRRSRRSGTSRADMREHVRGAQHGQRLREEAATMGGREERARFYGTGEFGYAGGDGEDRVTIAQAERERQQYEAEEAERYAGRRRRQSSAEFRLPWE